MVEGSKGFITWDVSNGGRIAYSVTFLWGGYFKWQAECSE